MERTWFRMSVAFVVTCFFGVGGAYGYVNPLPASASLFSNQNQTRISGTTTPANMDVDAECTLFVSSSGTDSNPGTQAAPFKSIQRAANVVVPGDVVCVADGVYRDDGISPTDHIVYLNRGGTSVNWIEFRAEHPGGAVLDGQGNAAGYAFTFGNEAGYIRVEGFEVRGTAHGGFWANSAANHVELIGNHIHHIGRLCDFTPYGIVGIYLGSSGANFTLDRNLIHHVGRLHPEDGCSYSGDFSAYKNSDHGMYLQGDNVLITNNIFYENTSGWGIQVTSSATNYRIINNTFVGANPNRDGHIVLYPTSNLLIQNNISYQSTGYMVNPITSLNQCTNCVIRNNLTDLTTMVEPGYERFFTIANNFVGTDPGFVDPAATDFHLTSGSFAIDQGLSDEAPTFDYGGTQRPQGQGVDIGAHEFVGEATTATFVDVPFDHWAHDEIEALYQAGYVAGCSANPLMYCPEGTMTRAESAVFVERGIHGAGYLPGDPVASVFADVPLIEWFAKWANGLWEDGYTAGCGTDPLIYCPLQEHTRTEGSVFFLRMLNGSGYVPSDPEGLFADVAVDFWGAKWIEAAYIAEVIPACETSPELKFCPEAPLDRAMGAYMMVQAKGLDIP
jgi:hypothetical protein